MSLDQMTKKGRATASEPKAPKPRRTSVRGSLPARSKSRGALLVGLLLVVGSALIGALLFINAGDRVTVLSVREAVAPGQQIERSNLVSKQVAGVDDAVPVEDASSVVGKTATVGLVPGQVLARSMVTTKPVPGTGQALAGLALTRAQMPGAGIDPGDTVRVLAVPNAETAGTDLKQATVLAQSAQVYAVAGVSEGEASKVVTVVLPAADADRVQTFAAAGRVAIVKTAPQTQTGGE